jgi:diketogulonate reductase-like aldo/keto reductase
LERFVDEDGGSKADVWVTTKMHPRDHGATRSVAAVERSLAALQTDKIDLVLLHYPRCWAELCGADHVPEGASGVHVLVAFFCTF